MIERLAHYQIEGMMMRYSVFMPRFYNFCKASGMQKGKIMPSRAFCSDESQGFPIILIAKHFGTFPFNHGRVGGIVATDRHGPHAQHGKDLVIIQASHVGYDPETETFGDYRRNQTEHHESSTTCGKISAVLQWYMDGYRFAKNNIFLYKKKNDYFINIDNQLLREDRNEGLFLNFSRLVTTNNDGTFQAVHSYSTSRSFHASGEFIKGLSNYNWSTEKKSIGDLLVAELFSFRREIEGDAEGQEHLERSLLNLMPYIVISKTPLLTAAQASTQIEFDRTFRTISDEPQYKNKKLIFISGLNIDISPKQNQLFPLTKFVPWAAYIQEPDGTYTVMEQAELYAQLEKQSTENPDQIDLELAIEDMKKEKEVSIKV